MIEFDLSPTPDDVYSIYAKYVALTRLVELGVFEKCSSDECSYPVAITKTAFTGTECIFCIAEANTCNDSESYYTSNYFSVAKDKEFERLKPYDKSQVKFSEEKQFQDEISLLIAKGIDPLSRVSINRYNQCIKGVRFMPVLTSYIDGKTLLMTGKVGGYSSRAEALAEVGRHLDIYHNKS